MLVQGKQFLLDNESHGIKQLNLYCINMLIYVDKRTYLSHTLLFNILALSMKLSGNFYHVSTTEKGLPVYGKFPLQVDLIFTLSVFSFLVKSVIVCISTYSFATVYRATYLKIKWILLTSALQQYLS
jgi:hypothetical protein